MTTGSRRGWLVPPALIALSVIPLVSGALRLVEVAGGPALMPDNPRVDASPVPVVVHVLAAAVYALVGAFQFPARLRRNHRTWHRRAGRVLVVAGLLVAGSGLWMTLFYAGAPGGWLLWAVRLVVSSAMGTALVLGFTAIRRRDLPSHRAWMIRAYALGLGAGTQVLTQGLGQAAFGTGELSTALSVSAGWVVNAAVAEVVIRRSPRRSGPSRHPGTSARILARTAER
ncbi:DUF2306 domain-containing protein [Nocardioides iriomotensis]|uniref:DUF2306 domain-containing protein n=1 Tax=Nocardioides iriomotensis TaxID=715784 RepID=A0A4Q5IZW2_9ACTN|nr:DUF2306 domain-containing protein [Nocardioides iriomotensis]RYU10631.1 DUF2306 domain-containing protein [Nocardioides iriomotensis]